MRTNRALILLIALSLLGCNSKELPGIKGALDKLQDAREREIDKQIKNNDAVRELDGLCRSVGESQNFRLVGRSISSNGPKELYFYYESDLDFHSADRGFREFLTGNGWQEVGNRSFNPTVAYKKDDKQIVIQYGGIGGEANYGITCGQVKSN